MGSSEASRKPFAAAAVFVGPGKPLKLYRFPRPVLEAGELLVEVTCCTLCGSDLHSIQGKREVPVPSILGHEVVGRVVAWGGDQPPEDLVGRTIREGDRVSWAIATRCGTCFYCLHGVPQKCEKLFKYGHQALTERHPLSGGLATHCHLKANTAVLCLPDELSDYVVSPANCATATVAAALRVAGGCAGEVVLIQGAGMLGLSAAAICSRMGAELVLISDVEPRRLSLAGEFGATDTIIVGDDTDSLSERVRSCTKGRGVDLVLELSGSSAATELGMEQLRIGGRMILVGAVFPGPPVSMLAERVVRRLLRIEGLHNYRPEDLVTAVQFLRENHERFPFERLIGAEFSLSELTEATRYARESGALRVAVRPRASEGCPDHAQEKEASSPKWGE